MPRPQRYGADVVRILTEDLPALDLDAHGVIRLAVSQFHSRPYDHFECIVDSVVASRWRLKPRAPHSNMVRLAACWPEPSDEQRAIEARVNERLDAL